VLNVLDAGRREFVTEHRIHDVTDAVEKKKSTRSLHHSRIEHLSE